MMLILLDLTGVVDHRPLITLVHVQIVKLLVEQSLIFLMNYERMASKVCFIVEDILLVLMFVLMLVNILKVQDQKVTYINCNMSFM